MPTPYILHQLSSGLVRLRVTPDEPEQGPPAITAQRPRGSRRPHSAETIAKVRNLFEHTDLTYAEIAAKTGVATGIITRWKRAGAWRRPAHAPRATEMVPDWRAGRRLRLRKLAFRLAALARRCVRELEEAPDVDIETLVQALEVQKSVRLEAMGRKGRGGVRVGPVVTGAWLDGRDDAIRTALTEMRSTSSGMVRRPDGNPIPPPRRRRHGPPLLLLFPPRPSASA